MEVILRPNVGLDLATFLPIGVYGLAPSHVQLWHLQAPESTPWPCSVASSSITSIRRNYDKDILFPVQSENVLIVEEGVEAVAIAVPDDK